MKHIALCLLGFILIGSACQQADPELGPPPTEQDAQIFMEVSPNSNNILLFRCGNEQLLATWDFGNQTGAKGTAVEGRFPYAGTYTVQVRVFNKGGSRTNSIAVTIDQDDLSLLDHPVFNALTGGLDNGGVRTWRIDSMASGHMGVGPDPESAAGAIPEWWAANPADKTGCGIYDDRYTFSLSGFDFTMQTNGDVYVHNTIANEFPGSFLNKGDYTAPYDDNITSSWNLVEEGENSFLEISGSAFLGFYSGVRTYRILDFSDSHISLQYKHHAGGLHWYIKLVPAQ